MANYTIIGGDGKQYGPITGNDLRKWISEGRLNAQSLAKAESDAEFRPLSTFPELADAFAPQAAMPDAPPVFAPATLTEGDYELDIGDCVSRGWKLFKENMGTLFGAFIVSILLAIVGISIINTVLVLLTPKAIIASPVLRQFFNIALQAGVAVVMGPLFGGLYYIFIQRMRGRPADVGDIFIGFKKMFSQLFLGNFAVGFFVGLCMIPYNLASAAKVEPLLEQMKHTSSPTDIQNIMPELWAAIFSTLPVLLVCMIPVTYLAVNWLFTLPLIIDMQMKFWPAMMASWKKVHQHWWLLLGFTVVIGLLNLAGVCACCVGVLFTAPVGIAAMMFAYETIFGRAQTR